MEFGFCCYQTNFRHLPVFLHQASRDKESQLHLNSLCHWHDPYSQDSNSFPTSWTSSSCCTVLGELKISHSAALEAWEWHRWGRRTGKPMTWPTKITKLFFNQHAHSSSLAFDYIRQRVLEPNPYCSWDTAGTLQIGTDYLYTHRTSTQFASCDAYADRYVHDSKQHLLNGSRFKFLKITTSIFTHSQEVFISPSLKQPKIAGPRTRK